MVSDIFREDYNQLKSQGINLDLDDIIRLNSLALTIEKGKYCTFSPFNLPRVIHIKNLDREIVSFYEPTIGHNIWLDEVLNFFEVDTQTIIALKAFCYSHKSHDELPASDNIKLIVSEMMKFKKSLSELTMNQISISLAYVIFGNSYISEEYAYYDLDNDEDLAEGDISINLGYLLLGIAYSSNLTLKDAMKMTKSQISYIIYTQNMMNDLVDTKKEKLNLTGDYYKTLEYIKEKYASGN